MTHELNNKTLVSAIHTLHFLPDRDRAAKNVETFLTENPSYSSQLHASLEPIALLFSYSQFLANYCIHNPRILFDALDNLIVDRDTEKLRSDLRALLAACSSPEEGLKAVRSFKRNYLLIITLKDICNRADFRQVILELSNLADAILSETLIFIDRYLGQRYGTPENNAIAIIALGKLGAQELNYSSDVDIIFVYRNEGETSGIVTAQGTPFNRISVSEYYTKLAEEMTRFLSRNTEDGFCYRVDLRLRPQGQRGNLVLSLRSYEEYYESWGQLWERVALLRARPVAGDGKLGNDFLEVIRPFVYRKYLDFDAIDEIRRMKTQVEQLKSDTLSRDIKRGYGGIREIEFFIQVFQLMYGGREPLLKERDTQKALHKLLQKGLIGYEDLHHLSDNYLFLRTLEHRLQQLNDLQTHMLPSQEQELCILGRKMGFSDGKSFSSELYRRRLKVRTIYDSLLQSQEKHPAGESSEESATGVLDRVFWDMDTPIEHLIREELSKTAVTDHKRALHCLMKVRNNIYSFQTIRGRRLLEDVIPRFVNEALAGSNPDLALLQLVDFSVILATSESYLEVISQRPEFIASLNFVFSHSEYLSKILMSNPQYIESLVEGEGGRKPLRTLQHELDLLVERQGTSPAIRSFKRLKEVRLGILFLNKNIGVARLMRALSRIAEVILTRLVHQVNTALPQQRAPSSSLPLMVIAFGKLGGREITFNSDLDITFVTEDEPTPSGIKAAERLLSLTMSYTKEGIAYRVDTRLRPDGSKGPLVNSLKGLTAYYERNAHIWELQALLKARPITGNVMARRQFMCMRRDVLRQRGFEMTASDISRMRERIRKELSKEIKDRPVGDAPSVAHYDIKLGIGGIEELEFAIQFLQMRHCKDNPHLLVQGTCNAIRRLHQGGILGDSDRDSLLTIYIFYRTVQTMLRLRNESVLKEGSTSLQGIASFMEMDGKTFLRSLERKRQWISNFSRTVGIE